MRTEPDGHQEITAKVHTMMGQIGLSATSVETYIKIYDCLMAQPLGVKMDEFRFIGYDGSGWNLSGLVNDGWRAALGDRYFITCRTYPAIHELRIEPQTAEINPFGVMIIARRLWRRRPIFGCKTYLELETGKYTQRDMVALDKRVFLDRFLRI